MKFNIYRASENDLVAGCRKGDKNAQKRLFETYSSKMYAICYRYVHRSMEAEDILVTAFTRVFEKIDQFKGEGSLEGWIRRIMVNEALTFLRKNKSVYLETDLEQANHEPDYQQLENHLQAEDLLAMIGELPQGYKIVFNMYAIDGYSHKEISEQLGISENTSKSQLSRARAHMQKMLAENDAWLTQKFK
jgi:RNA polymerase sigma factor (sigma-70 family)